MTELDYYKETNPFYKWLMSIEWLNFKDRYAITQAGVHVLFCFSLMSVVTCLLVISKWIAFGYTLAIIYPLIKEYVIDGHKCSGETEEEIVDLRTDLLTNYLGVVLGIPFAVISMLF